MGVRKLLKTSLALLAVGGVSYAGLANAATQDELVVEQHYSGEAKVAKSEKESDKKFEQKSAKDSPNKAYVIEAGKNTYLYGFQHDGNNQIGANNAKLVFKTADKSDYSEFEKDSKGTVKVTIKQSGGDNKFVKETLSDAPAGSPSVISNNGDITVSLSQDGKDETYLGLVKSTKDGASITINLSQDDGVNKTHFSKIEADGSISINMWQHGGGNEAYFGSDSTGVDSTGVDVGGDLSVHAYNDDSKAMEQNGSDKLIVNRLVTGANADLGITQTGTEGTIEIKNVNSASAFTLNADQEGNKDTITLGVDDSTAFKSTSGDITLDITQKGDGTNSVVIANSQEVSVGSADITITQDNDKASGANKVIIDDLTVDGKLTAKINMDNNGDGTNVFQILGGSVDGDLTVKGYSDDTLDIVGTSNTVTFKDVDSEKDATLAMDISGDENKVIVEKIDNTKDSETLSFKTSITGDKNLIRVDKIEGQGVDADIFIHGNNNKIVALDNPSSISGVDNLKFDADEGLTQIASAGAAKMDIDIGTSDKAASDNQIALYQEADQTATFKLSIAAGANNNQVLVYQKGSDTAFADISISSSDNVVKIYQKTVSGTNASVHVDVN